MSNSSSSSPCSRPVSLTGVMVTPPGKCFTCKGLEEEEEEPTRRKLEELEYALRHVRKRQKSVL